MCQSLRSALYTQMYIHTAVYWKPSQQGQKCFLYYSVLSTLHDQVSLKSVIPLLMIILKILTHIWNALMNWQREISAIVLSFTRPCGLKSFDEIGVLKEHDQTTLLNTAYDQEFNWTTTWCILTLSYNVQRALNIFCWIYLEPSIRHRAHV